MKKLALIMGAQEFVRASCVGPVRLVNSDPCREDIRRFAKSLAGRSVRGFLNAASPGLITAFQPNTFYPSHEAYLAVSRHTGYQDVSEEEFLKIAAANVEALSAATADIPPERMRMHVCWGNY